SVIDCQPFAERIETADHRNPIENEWLARRGWRTKHNAAAGDLKSPRPLGLRRRFDLPEQSESIVSGNNLEWHFEKTARRIPIDCEFRPIDLDPTIAAVTVADRARTGDDAANQRLRYAVAVDLAAQARRKRQIDLHCAVIKPRGQQKIIGRHLARFECNAAMAIARRFDRSGETPRMFRIFRTYRDG